MYEKSTNSNTVQFEQFVAPEGVATSDRLIFLNYLPSVPVYVEILPDGLIEDEI